MNEIRERAKWLVDMLRDKDDLMCSESLALKSIRDLLAELERVEKIAEPIESGKVVAELTRLNQRIAELEAENNRLNTLLHKASQKSAEDFTEFIKDARTQAAKECIEIIDKYPAFLFGTDAVGVKLNLSQGIKAHFKTDDRKICVACDTQIEQETKEREALLREREK